MQTFRLSHYFTDRRRLLRHKQFHKPTLLEEYELVQTCFQVNARKMFERKILSTRRDGLKVDEPYSYTLLIGTPIFEWCVIGYGSKNGYKRDTCLKEIGWHMKYANHSRFNGQRNWRDLYDYWMSTRIFTLMMHKTRIWTLKIMRKAALIW